MSAAVFMKSSFIVLRCAMPGRPRAHGRQGSTSCNTEELATRARDARRGGAGPRHPGVSDAAVLRSGALAEPSIGELTGVGPHAGGRPAAEHLSGRRAEVADAGLPV